MAYQDQAEAYSRGRFGLNVMRWQDDAGLNLKPFEITLSGACLLQAYRAGIEDHFDDSEMVLFRTPQEARAKVADLLADPPRLEQTAAAGRAQSLAKHCWKHRAAEVTRVLLGEPSPTPQTSPTNAPAGNEATAPDTPPPPQSVECTAGMIN